MGKLSFRLRASPVGNLVYQLDCLAKRIACSRPMFEAHWRPSWTTDDDRVLAEWADVRRAYDVTTPLAEVGPPRRTTFPLPERAFELGKHVRIASLVAEDPRAWSTNLALLLDPSHVSVLERGYRHFAPRFERWWAEAGGASAERFLDGLHGVLANGEVGHLVDEVARFYGAQLSPGTTIVFDVIAAPKSDHRSSTAEQIANHSVIEVLEGTMPEARLGVVTHELFHFFHNSRTREAEAALIDRFTGSSDPLATVAYGLLDESLATMLGNGLVASRIDPTFGERATRPRSFYQDDGIDRTAKALFARVNEVLAAGLSSDAFVPLMLRAAHEGVGEAPPTSEWLRTSNAAFSGELETGRSHLEDAIRPNNLWTYGLGGDAIDAFAKHTDLSGVVFVTPRDLPRLAQWRPVIPPKDLAALARATKRPTVYGVKRSSHAYLWIGITEASSLEETIMAFAKKRAFVGFME